MATKPSKYHYLSERQAISILKALVEELRDIAHEKGFMDLEPELSRVVRKMRSLDAEIFAKTGSQYGEPKNQV